MENRSKFFKGGSWDGYTLYDRFVITKWALDAHLNHNGSAWPYIDDEELVFIIKNAFVSKILISQTVVDDINKVLISNPGIFGKKQSSYDNLIKEYYLSYLDFDICDLGKTLNNQRKKFPGLPHIVVEHVVPGEVYISEIKRLFICKKYDFTAFLKFFVSISICLVTEPQNKALNSYKSSMPLGYEDFISYPFARYQKVGVEIYGWDIVDGHLKRKTK